MMIMTEQKKWIVIEIGEAIRNLADYFRKGKDKEKFEEDEWKNFFSWGENGRDDPE